MTHSSCNCLNLVHRECSSRAWSSQKSLGNINQEVNKGSLRLCSGPVACRAVPPRHKPIREEQLSFCQINRHLVPRAIQWLSTCSHLPFPVLPHILAARLQVQLLCRSALRTKCALQACTTLQCRVWYVPCLCSRLNSGCYLLRVAAKVDSQGQVSSTSPPSILRSSAGNKFKHEEKNA